jgi:NOL1/NOP2/sun family putative RNA methylase
MTLWRKKTQRPAVPREHELVARYEQLLGEPLLPVVKRDCLRVNTLRHPSDLLERLARKGAVLEAVPSIANAYWFSSEKSLGATPEYLLGYYYLQEAASQLPALVLAPPEHSVVLDMAASPGSKTTQLAALMSNTGVIVAVEQKSNRMQALAENLERCGVINTVLFRKDARFIKDFHRDFTHILLDAPCSGNYVIEPEFFAKKSLKSIKEMVEVQRELLKAAASALADGGTLVYSTCSLEPEENEEQIAWLLGKYPALTLVDTGLSIGEPGYSLVFGKSLPPNVRLTRRLWPQRTGTQAFFIAKLVKNSSS